MKIYDIEIPLGIVAGIIIGSVMLLISLTFLVNLVPSGRSEGDKAVEIRNTCEKDPTFYTACQGLFLQQIRDELRRIK